MKFLQNIDDTYINASVENKQRLLRMVWEKVTYDTENEKLTVKLKPMFEHLRLIKAERMLSENLYRTHKTRSDKARKELTIHADTINQI